MTPAPAPDDELLLLAFSLHSNPGAYAVLFGAGVSAPSGIPTAWGVLEDLVERLAELHQATPQDAVKWYESVTGKFPTYEGVLERIAPTQVERQSLLRTYFEQSTADVEAERKLPTSAHRSLARLVKSGAVRVILTLNFDHLIERSLRDEGIEPTIIASPADIEGMAPLHTLDCCVIHLHGDYLNPTTMLNTAAELRSYHPTTEKFLRLILENYGIIAAGWSSRYDPALRSAIASHYPARFTLSWIEPGDESEEAANLRALKKGVLVCSTADDALGRLADGVDALGSRKARHPLTVALAVETAKRELAGRTVAIGLHDTLRREFAALHRLPEFNLADHQTAGDYQSTVSRVEEATKVTAALVATLAYWGDDTTDQWWIDELLRFAAPADGSGLVKMLSLRVITGGMLFYAAGVSAAAAQRFDLLERIFSLQQSNRYSGEYEPLALIMDSEAGYEGAADIHTRMFTNVAALLAEATAAGREVIDDAWQTFEVLRLSWALHRDSRFPHLAAHLAEMSAVYETAQANFDAAAQGVGGDINPARTAQTQALHERDRAIGSLCALVRAGRPHILTVDHRGNERYQSTTARRLVHEMDSEGANHPVLKSRLSRGSKEFELAMEAVSTRLGQIGRDLSWERVQQSVGFIPSQVWLDTGKTPFELQRQTTQPEELPPWG